MTIKVLIACSGANFSFAPNHEYDVSEELGKDLINAGYAEKAKKTTTRRKAESGKEKNDA